MPEVITGFHFAEPAWLWALLAPVPVALWLALTASVTDNARMQRYADHHLLPHLLGTHQLGAARKWRRFGYWALVWLLGVLAMAGPRWSFTDVQVFRPNSDLVVVLDISQSMEVTDVRPSRLARARHELEDLLSQSQGIRVGLIAFASVAHVISPITEDTWGIRRLLPALSTDLVRLQGSRLSTALKRAEQLLTSQAQRGSQSVLLISDGDFVEAGLEAQLRALAQNGIRTHVLGIGMPQGGIVPGPNHGPLLDQTRTPVRSQLNEPLLRSLATAGQGEYQRAEFRDADIRRIASLIGKQTSVRTVEDTRTRVWHERFYWLVGLALLLLIPQYRRIKFPMALKAARADQ